MLETINTFIPLIQDAHKKTPVDIRLNALNDLNRMLLTTENFKQLQRPVNLITN